MTVTAEALTRKFNSNKDKKVEGGCMALRHVGDLLGSQMTHESFDYTVRHISSAGDGDNIPAARKAFNEGYLETLEALMEI